jgi:hypothetical protein
VHDPRLPEFARKVELLPNTDLLARPGLPEGQDREPTQGPPRWTPVKVEIHARNEVFSAATNFAWGDPWTSESAMSDEDLKHKYRTFCSGVLRSERIEESLEVIFGLEDVADLSRELMPLLS